MQSGLGIGFGAEIGRSPTGIPVVRVRASWVALMVKYLPANAGDIRDADSIPGLGRSAGGEHAPPSAFLSFLLYFINTHLLLLVGLNVTFRGIQAR